MKGDRIKNADILEFSNAQNIILQVFKRIENLEKDIVNIHFEMKKMFSTLSKDK